MGNEKGIEIHADALGSFVVEGDPNDEITQKLAKAVEKLYFDLEEGEKEFQEMMKTRGKDLVEKALNELIEKGEISLSEEEYDNFYDILLEVTPKRKIIVKRTPDNRFVESDTFYVTFKEHLIKVSSCLSEGYKRKLTILTEEERNLVNIKNIVSFSEIEDYINKL